MPAGLATDDLFRGSALADLGFREGELPAEYRRGRITAAVRDDWLVVRLSSGRVPRDPLRRNHDARGPWRWSPNGSDRVWHRTFELPLGVVSGFAPGGSKASTGDALHAAAAWALATSSGRCPAGWEPPALERVRERLSDLALTVRRGGLVRQGELVHAPDRLTIRFPLVEDAVPGATQARGRWMRRLLSDAQARWRWVRIGTDRRGAAHLEIDLTGMPDEWTEPLTEAALDALRTVVDWIIEPADFLANCAEAVQALEIRP